MKAYNLGILNQTISKLREQVLPIRVMYNLIKLSDAVKREAQFYDEALRELLQRYAEIDENGQFILAEDGANVRLKPETIEQCNKEYEALNNNEVNLPDIHFSLSDLENANLNFNELSVLMEFIAE